MVGEVRAVARSFDHRFSKSLVASIELIAGFGIEGDAHAGITVQHRSRVRADPTQPNLRQVHLIHDELFADMTALGFAVLPGALGENITTRGVDLLHLPCGTRLQLGKQAVVRLTGLRNPCVQIGRFEAGLMHAVLDRDVDGRLMRKAGVMAVVDVDGTVRPGDPIEVELPDGPHDRLEPV